MYKYGVDSMLSNEEFKKNLDLFKNKITPEYLKQLEEICYFDDRDCQENFSYWYPKIKSFGKFRHPEIVANQIFTQDEIAIMEKTDKYDDVNWEDWYKILWNTLQKMEPHKLYNIKNGCFSNKFDFSTCVTNKLNLAKNLWKINYQSAMFNTEGKTELVVREFIPYNIKITPTIYNGMPLREELRVFYNMNDNKIEYMEDYWNYDYCINNLPNKTDEIVFNWFHNKLRKRHEQHIHEINKMKAYIKDNINTLKFEGLNGIWSIDFMKVTGTEKHNGIWLIDMARGYKSAYWNPARLTQDTKRALGIIGKKKENEDENNV